MKKIFPILVLLFFSIGIDSSNLYSFPSANLTQDEPELLSPIVFQNQNLVYNNNVLINNLQIFGNVTFNRSRIIFLPISGFNDHNDIIVESGAYLTFLSSIFDYSLNVINPSFSITLKENSSLIINNTIIENNQNKNSDQAFIHGQPKTLIIDQSTIINTEFPINVTINIANKKINSMVKIQRNLFHNNYGKGLIEIKGYNEVEISNNTLLNDWFSITKGISIENVNTSTISNNKFIPYYPQLDFKNNNIINIFQNEINNQYPQNNGSLYFTNNNYVTASLNRFTGFKQPIIFNNSLGDGIITLNDFYGENPEIMFQNHKGELVIFVNNYYEKISFLDLDSDGFSDTSYFLDQSPLMFPYDSYEIKKGVLTLTNPYLIILSQNKPVKPFWDNNLTLFGLYNIFMLIILFFLIFKNKIRKFKIIKDNKK
ncbi:MAG: hypothetical protein HeimC3_38360 [Candidatus Heimdallarchaeota archaeon LC_3]|nr:MAG: hypothetical protein HeimC3_38360 [Candidatus Heimdallarchaeota archaeon LC_3]